MQRSRPIIYHAMLLTGVNLLLRFGSTGFSVFISGRIGAEALGLLQLVMSINSLAVTAGMGGIRTATMYLSAEQLGVGKHNTIGSVLKGCILYSLLISCTVALIVYLLAPTLASGWIGNPATASALRCFAAFLPIICLTGVMTGYFTAAKRIATLAATEVLEQLIYMLTTMLLLFFWVGSAKERACSAIVFGTGISSTFTLFILLALYHKRPHKPRTNIPIAARLLRTAIPLALADDLKAGINTGENLMVPRRLAMYPGVLSPLASFGLVTGMVFPIMMFPAAILYALAELLIPELARCNAAGHKMRVQYLVNKTWRVGLLYGSVCCAVLISAALPLCTSLYGNADAAPYLRLFSSMVPMLYCDALTDAMIKGLGQQLACVRYNILTSAMDVALLFILLPKLGMFGYFISFMITHFINFLLSLRRLIRISQVRLSLSFSILTPLCTVLSILLSEGIHWVWGRIGALLAIFFSLAMLFRVITKKDYDWIVGMLYKKRPIA